MPRKRRYRKELLDNGTLTSPSGIELAKIDLETGTFVINELALYKYLLTGPYYGNQTPITKINMTFGMTGGWTLDTAVAVVLYSMEDKKLVNLIIDEDGDLKAVKPIATLSVASKKLPKYTTRAEQYAGLSPLEDNE